MRRAARSFPALALAALLSACGGDASGPSTNFTIGVGAAAPTTLGTQVTFDVMLTSTGFAGTVTLTVLNAPATWNVAVGGGNVATLAANGNATKTVTITIPSNGAAAPTGQVLTVQAVSASGTRTITKTITVTNEFIVVMPNGTGAGTHWGTIVGTNVQLRVGTAFRFRNDDGTTHQIHFDGDIPGFVHQPDPGITQGQSYVVTSTGAGVEDNVHCHIHGTGVGTFTVTVS